MSIDNPIPLDSQPKKSWDPNIDAVNPFDSSSSSEELNDSTEKGWADFSNIASFESHNSRY